MSEAQLEIERMCYGGAGFGRVEGKACFVPFSAPGDQARVRISRAKKNYLEAELVDTISPSPHRVAPPCPFFGACGGCNWQHLDYQEQLRQKGEIFSDTLRRIGRVEGAEMLPVLGSVFEYGYRSRIQLKVSAGKVGVRIGFFRGATHEVIDLADGCPIAHPLLNRITAELREVLPRLSEVAAIPQVDLSMGDDGQSIAIVHLNGEGGVQLSARLLGERKALASVSGLFLREGAKTRLRKVFGVERLEYRIPERFLPGSREMRLGFSRGGFSQVNYGQNLNLLRTVWQWGEFTGQERVLDLYCGNGNLSIPIAPYVAEMVGVEGYAPSVEDALLNARNNGIANASFLAQDAAQALRAFARKGEQFDLLILDPPRSGSECAAALALLAPQRIIYVSCDPPTLARDLGTLQGEGYRVLRSQPVDMFPQTYHLESVTLLQRNS